MSSTNRAITQAAFTSLTTAGSCAAGNMIVFRIGRDGTQATDTSSGNLLVIGMALKEQHN
jgi:hypothetical protein